MEFVRHTLHLYAQVAGEALKSLRNHTFKPLVGIPFIFLLGFLEQFLGRLQGFAGGMVRGLVLTLLMAMFLSFIALFLEQKRFNYGEVWERATGIFGPLINSLFLLFIAQLLLFPLLMKPGNEPLLRLVNIALLVLFNPLPEMVSKRGVGGLEAFKESLEFMRENGPEWLTAFLLLLGPVMLALSPFGVLSLLTLTDPLSGIFILLRTGIGAFFDLGGVFGLRLLFLLLGIYYIFFLFLVRMALFEKLSTSTRRKRAYALRN